MPDGQNRSRLICFATFQVDPVEGELSKQGRKIKLQGQPFELLVRLLERPGELVTRDELKDRIWGSETVIDFDHGLNRAINKVREALGDLADNPRYIETVPRRGYRFIGAIQPPATEVERILETAPADRPVPPRLRSSRPTLWIGLVALAILLIGFIAASLQRKPAAAPLVRFSVFPPENTVFGNGAGPAVSPDGRRIVFAALPISGEGWQLWLRSLDAVSPLPLPDTQGGSMPFWSPDSRSIGFFADGKLKRIDVSGPSGPGAAVTLCASLMDGGGSWNRDGVILFGTPGALYRVPDRGGSPTPATKLDEKAQEHLHLFPWFLPDGRRFLFEAVARPLSPDHVTVRVGSLDSQQSKVLLETDSGAIFVHGRLLYVRDNILVAQPFDSRSLMITGPATPVAEHIIAAGVLQGLRSFSAAENGPLVYFAGTEEPPFELFWFDRNGNRSSSLGGVRTVLGIPFSSPNLSPDQRTIAFASQEGNNTDIWLQDAAGGLRTRFTFDPAKEIGPVWSRDSRTIVFSSSRKGRFDLYRRAADGSEPEELLYADNKDKYASSWSPDGKFLLYDSLQDQEPWSRIWVLPLAADESGSSLKPFPLLQTSATQGHAQFSPDGRWIVYESQETGQLEIYLAPFGIQGAAPTWKRQVSTAGGAQARWRGDGKEIFYRSGRRLMAAPINIQGTTVEVGEARQIIGSLSILGYDVTSDGQRILVMTRTRRLASQPLTVVQNWTAMLKK